jgi:hypothetical protein
MTPKRFLPILATPDPRQTRSEASNSSARSPKRPQPHQLAAPSAVNHNTAKSPPPASISGKAFHRANTVTQMFAPEAAEIAQKLLEQISQRQISAILSNRPNIIDRCAIAASSAFRAFGNGRTSADPRPPANHVFDADQPQRNWVQPRPIRDAQIVDPARPSPCRHHAMLHIPSKSPVHSALPSSVHKKSNRQSAF